MTNYDVIKKLLGSINPIGETNTDNQRYENLEETIELTNKLLDDIYNVSNNRHRIEFSMKKAGQRAYVFLNEINNFK